MPQRIGNIQNVNSPSIVTTDLFAVLGLASVTICSSRMLLVAIRAKFHPSPIALLLIETTAGLVSFSTICSLQVHNRETFQVLGDSSDSAPVLFSSGSMPRRKHNAKSRLALQSLLIKRARKQFVCRVPPRDCGVLSSTPYSL